ncbi:hypothetical protein QN277_004076 [Acacia crassicarpa]|uniref:Beta-catenin-like protein 1 N-terminal domain-containing protein n=1 Tax=Acacia crassicarpa TaxID=499986 RepID=A0AAE1MG99_9FABA|nr:hypothetical protein QN277_004076 [Acacia crassicarpa]
MKVANAHNYASKRKFGDIISPSSSLLTTASSNGFDNNNNINGINLSLLKAFEKSQSSVEVLDLKALKKLVLTFEGCLTDNIEARLKYPNQPDQFTDSRIKLHEELQKLKVLAGAPELYLDLINLNVVPFIVDLLNYGHTDIAIDVVQLLQDLTDEGTRR